VEGKWLYNNVCSRFDKTHPLMSFIQMNSIVVNVTKNCVAPDFWSVFVKEKPFFPFKNWMWVFFF
jgi:hypothetical protein